MNGKKSSETTKLRHGKNFFSEISKKRKVFSGGKTFNDKEAARAAQRKAVESRKRNTELRRLAEQSEGEAA